MRNRVARLLTKDFVRKILIVMVSVAGVILITKNAEKVYAECTAYLCDSVDCAMVKGKCKMVGSDCGTKHCPCTTSESSWKCVKSGGGCKAKPETVKCHEFGGDPDDPPTCTPSDCTPLCPAGQQSYNTGNTPAPQASCTYLTGAVSGSSCVTGTKSLSCWYDPVPPIVTPTPITSTTSLGCSLMPGHVGKEGTNRLKVDFTFGESQTAGDPVVALFAWFSPGSPTVISKIGNKGYAKLQSNDSFGILITKVNGAWSDIYVPGNASHETAWVKVGTVGNGLRGQISGAGGEVAIGIHDVLVNAAGANISTSYTLEFYNSTSEQSAFESITDGTYKIYGATRVSTTFLPAGGDTIAIAPILLDTGRTFVLDMTLPTIENVNFAVSGLTTLNLSWKFSDGSGSGIMRVVGDGVRSKEGTTNDTIDDITSGVNNFVLGSGATGDDLYAGSPHLWRVDNVTNRVEVINIQTNEGGELQFPVHAFDKSCNMAQTTVAAPLGTAWFTTKGGLVYSHGGSTLSLIEITGHERISEDSIWNDPFGFYRDESDITSESLVTNASTLEKLLYSVKLNTVRAVNIMDENRKTDYWFNKLSQKTENKVKREPAKYTVFEFPANLSASGKSRSISQGFRSCTNTKPCVVKIAADLTIEEGFVCDAATLFLVQGNVTVNPDVTASGFSNGCVVVAKGNITFTAGSYKSSGSTYPKYDLVEGLFIADGQIIIEESDTAASMRDGLKIHGGLLGFGITAGKSIEMNRSHRQLFNILYPAVAIHFDNRYLTQTVPFFGGADEVFKKEVGYKPL